MELHDQAFSAATFPLSAWARGSSAPTGATLIESAAQDTLEAAFEAGITFFDTADVYGDGRSERFCGGLLRRHPEVFVATKMGRRVSS